MADLQKQTSRARRDGARAISDSLVTRDAHDMVLSGRALPVSRALTSGAGRRASLARQTRSLQRSHGNQHVQRSLQRSTVQRAGTTVTIPTDVVRETYPIRGKTLEAVMYRLETGGEAGKGGVEDLLMEAEFGSNDKATTVTITGKLFTRLPVWEARDSRPAAEQREWDRFLGVLTRHENKHLSIAKTHLQAIKRALGGGLKSDVLNARWDAKIAALQAAQKAYDDATQNGISEGTVINLPESP